MYSDLEIGLGSQEIRQLSINSKVDLEFINSFIKKNYKKFKVFVDKNDEYQTKLVNYLVENKKFNFPLNKHIELFLKKNEKQKELVFKYLVHRYKFHLAGREKINIGYPPYVLIEPVSTCNLRCPFCFQTDKSFTRKPYMGVIKFDLLKKIIDECDQIGVGHVTLASRGEPTLHKNLIEIIEYISKKKNIFELKLNTNATFLSEKICHAIFKNKITQIVISADHYQEKNFEKLRKGSNFKDIVNNVDRLYNIRKKYYKDSITEIRVSGVDANKNLNREKFYQFWIKRCDHVTAGFPLERWDTYNNSPHQDITEPCENLWDRMYVWFDGKVNPCDADYKSYLSYGSLENSNILDIWNSKKIDKLRHDHINKQRLKHNPCDRCGVQFIK